MKRHVMRASCSFFRTIMFDRFFIDWYWAGHTKAWTIPGTEDLKPYIPKKTLKVKWLFTIVGNPLIAAFPAGIMLLVFR